MMLVKLIIALLWFGNMIVMYRAVFNKKDGLIQRWRDAKVKRTFTEEYLKMFGAPIPPYYDPTSYVYSSEETREAMEKLISLVPKWGSRRFIYYYSDRCSVLITVDYGWRGPRHVGVCQAPYDGETVGNGNECKSLEEGIKWALLFTVF